MNHKQTVSKPSTYELSLPYYIIQKRDYHKNE
nr:MAG TPA: hypothetical protein [Caudoviricetes sp.]